MRSSFRRLLPLIVASAVLLSACTEDISSREVMVGTLIDQGQLDQTQADCVADEMFTGGKFTPDQLKTVASGFNDDDGNEKIAGFAEYAEETITTCLGSSGSE